MGEHGAEGYFARRSERKIPETPVHLRQRPKGPVAGTMAGATSSVAGELCYWAVDAAGSFIGRRLTGDAAGSPREGIMNRGPVRALCAWARKHGAPAPFAKE